MKGNRLSRLEEVILGKIVHMNIRLEIIYFLATGCRNIVFPYIWRVSGDISFNFGI